MRACMRASTQAQAQNMNPTQSWGPAGYSGSNFRCHMDPLAQAPLFNITYGFVFVFIFNHRLGKNSKRDPRDQTSLPCVFQTARLSVNTSDRPLGICGFDVCNLNRVQLPISEDGTEEWPGIATVVT